MAVTIAPRLYLRLLGERAELPLGTEVWGDTTVELPRAYSAERSLRNVLDGSEAFPGREAQARHAPPDGGDADAGRLEAPLRLLVGEVLGHFPVALLTTSP
jgi:maltooligosyltrehalose synthase